MKLKTKSWNLDHRIVEGKAGGSFKLDFRPWHIVEGKRAKCK